MATIPTTQNKRRNSLLLVGKKHKDNNTNIELSSPKNVTLSLIPSENLKKITTIKYNKLNSRIPKPPKNKITDGINDKVTSSVAKINNSDRLKKANCSNSFRTKNKTIVNQKKNTALNLKKNKNLHQSSSVGPVVDGLSEKKLKFTKGDGKKQEKKRVIKNKSSMRPVSEKKKKKQEKKTDYNLKNVILKDDSSNDLSDHNNNDNITYISINDTRCEADVDVKTALLEQCGWLKAKLSEGIRKTDQVLDELKSIHSVCRSRSAHSETRSQQLASRFSDTISSSLNSVYEKFPSFKPKNNRKHNFRCHTSFFDKKDMEYDTLRRNTCSSLGYKQLISFENKSDFCHNSQCCKNGHNSGLNIAYRRTKSNSFASINSQNSALSSSSQNNINENSALVLTSQIENVGPSYLEAELKKCLARLAKLEVENKALRELLYNKKQASPHSSNSVHLEEQFVTDSAFIDSSNA